MFAIEFDHGLEKAWTEVAMFIPKLFAFLAVLVIGYFIVRAITRIVDEVLDHSGLNAAVSRSGLERPFANVGIGLSVLISKLVFWTLALTLLQFALGIFGTSPISDPVTNAIGYLPNIAIAIVVIVIAFGIAAAVKELVGAALSALPFGTAVAAAASIAILAIGIFAALNQLRVSPTVVAGSFYAALVVVVGVTVVAVGSSGIRPLETMWARLSHGNESKSVGGSSPLYTAADQLRERLGDPEQPGTIDSTMAAVAEVVTNDSWGSASTQDVVGRSDDTEHSEVTVRLDDGIDEPYESHTHEELYAEAQHRDISGRSDMDKATLIKALRLNDGIDEPYETHTHEELYAEAQHRNISGRSDMDKATLIKALRLNDGIDEPYETHTHEELYAEAQHRNISGRSDMDKATLIEALRLDDEGPRLHQT